MKILLTIILGAAFFLIQAKAYIYVYRRNEYLNQMKSFNLLKFLEGLFNLIIITALLYSSLFISFGKPKYLAFIDFDMYLWEFILLAFGTFFFWAFLIKRAFRKNK